MLENPSTRNNKHDDFIDAPFLLHSSPRRSFDPAPGLAVLDQLARMVEEVDRSLYEEHGAVARARISSRDPADKPVVATALLLNCPVWTEDKDFFGSGMATWTTGKIELYLGDVAGSQ
jgi:hypothetical protein